MGPCSSRIGGAQDLLFAAGIWLPFRGGGAQDMLPRLPALPPPPYPCCCAGSRPGSGGELNGVWDGPRYWGCPSRPTGAAQASAIGGCPYPFGRPAGTAADAWRLGSCRGGPAAGTDADAAPERCPGKGGGTKEGVGEGPPPRCAAPGGPPICRGYISGEPGVAPPPKLALMPMCMGEGGCCCLGGATLGVAWPTGGTKELWPPD
mmetsp:Transcript_63393/g.114225  ORF Transcript_63393/g.114225 Transcript_63393/m.114225 type:complete len:205 (+) Transcript_63393:1183-1797(+)